MREGATERNVFRAVADPTRRSMLEMLRGGDRAVSDFIAPFRISQPAVSQHLGVLRRAGLVRARRLGRKRVYRLNAQPITQVYDWAARYVRIADPAGHLWGVAEPPQNVPGPPGATTTPRRRSRRRR
ncbi:MAG: ArsR/SmtB family transcription factor [Candidatus Acidiferrales bacterium]